MTDGQSAMTPDPAPQGRRPAREARNSGGLGPTSLPLPFPLEGEGGVSRPRCGLAMQAGTGPSAPSLDAGRTGGGGGAGPVTSAVSPGLFPGKGIAGGGPGGGAQTPEENVRTESSPRPGGERLESWPVTLLCPTARTMLPPCTAQPRC